MTRFVSSSTRLRPAPKGLACPSVVRDRIDRRREAIMNDAVGTLPQALRRDFSAVDHDEAMRRAREIVPILRERAQAAEDARMLVRENEQLLHESGLFRFHQPKAFGGMELPFVALVDITDELARG